MRITQNIDTSAGSVTVRELTPGEVRGWLAEIANGIDVPVDLVGDYLFEGFALTELNLFIDGAAPDYDALTQSEIRAIEAAARTLNPDFFRFRQRLLAHGKVAGKTAENAP